jgi:hypothetical protein
MAKRDNTWTNQDGLYVGFGTRKAESNTGSNHGGSSAIRTMTLKIVGSELSDAVAAADLENAAVIPADSVILSANLFVTTAFAGVNAVLDIGTYKAADNTAEDDDGIDAAIATATLVDNYAVACDGADIGTVVTGSGYKIAASYDTAAFTAGEATLVVRYLVPSSA